MPLDMEMSLWARCSNTPDMSLTNLSVPCNNHIHPYTWRWVSILFWCKHVLYYITLYCRSVGCPALTQCCIYVCYSLHVMPPLSSYATILSFMAGVIRPSYSMSIVIKTVIPASSLPFPFGETSWETLTTPAVPLRLLLRIICSCSSQRSHVERGRNRERVVMLLLITFIMVVLLLF